MREADVPKKNVGLKRAIALFATGAVLSFGLCGVGVLQSFDGNQWWGSVASVSFWCFIVCIIGLLVSLIGLGVKRR